MHRSTVSQRRSPTGERPISAGSAAFASVPGATVAAAAPVARDEPAEGIPAEDTDGRSARFEPASPRSTVRRRAQRASYDPEVVNAILDAGFVAHVGFVHDDHPFVIPMAYARRDAELVLHGAAANRMLGVGASGVAMSVCVTLLDGLVYARSAFHHSVNYRSVVVLGHAREVSDPAEKRACLDAIVDRFSPGRSREVRTPTDKELAATRVLALAIEEASAKIRTGGPIDDAEDMAVPVWTGQLPVGLRAMSHIPTPDDAPRFALPARPHGID
jgi:nitroimidazol reductase NimA-like FMN-containing flavoprotein (pyridoxamine 5'-phosphate oxidase superfamily)